MTIKSDRWIKWMANEEGMIENFEGKQVKQIKGKNIVSYGLSSYGYDVRCNDSFKVFDNKRINFFDDSQSFVVDPKSFDERLVYDVSSDKCVIPPNSFALSSTVEKFKIPDDVLCICVGKSTYARCGIIVNVTPLEPGWEGYVTLEFSNTTPWPAVIHSFEGVAQMLFFQSDERCKVSYADRKGKYQNQSDITLPVL